jgi:hypothetical protein
VRGPGRRDVPASVSVTEMICQRRVALQELWPAILVLRVNDDNTPLDSQALPGYQAVLVLARRGLELSCGCHGLVLRSLRNAQRPLVL